MRVLIDACVLYPTVMREVVLAVAGQGLFQPLWSERILEEWARAARKLGPRGEAHARGDIALLRAGWPEAEVAADPGLEEQLWLPDPGDRHVLASAIRGKADLILTLNLKDFPPSVLAETGLRREAPDPFLMGLAPRGAVSEAARGVHATAERLSGEPIPIRTLFKKARLPRLGKALAV